MNYHDAETFEFVGDEQQREALVIAVEIQRLAGVPPNVMTLTEMLPLIVDQLDRLDRIIAGASNPESWQKLHGLTATVGAWATRQLKIMEGR